MSDSLLPVRLTRRHFLAGFAVAAAAPIWRGMDSFARAPQTPAFTGDNFGLTHKLLMRPEEILAQAAPAVDPALYDVVVVGAGISGLVSAYRLRNRRVLVLEGEQEIGGVSKSASWQGIEYALGAAYILDPDPDSEDPREKLGFQLLEELDLRRRNEDLRKDRRLQRRLSSDSNHCVFSSRRVVPEAEIYTARNRRFFEHILDSDNYPSVPVEDAGLAGLLDRVSFKAFLRDAALQRKVYGTTAGPVPRLGWEAIEYYCWGAFGTSAGETSAYHGLNFFVAEFGDVLVYPGGNAFIAKRLGERIQRDNPAALRTGAWTLRVEPGDSGWKVTTWEQGQLRQYRARNVIFAAPLFLASILIPSLPAAQRQILGALDYRSYVVANVLLRRSANAVFAAPAFRAGYEMTRVHGFDLDARSSEDLSKAKVYSDAILADFATGRHPTHGVLTVYRPYPYASGRAELLDLTYEAIEQEVRREVLAGFGPHGLRAGDIEGVRISRWGHPMIVTRPGLLADGTLAAAARSQPGLYFAHTDVMGAPAYENALAAAHDAVAAVRERLS